MRKDPTASSDFLQAKSWQRSNHSAETVLNNPDSNGPKFISHSLSGGELNTWFIQSGKNFADLTPLSGLDMKGDARSFALLDYDRDGWMDIALANPASPRTQLFRNKMATIVSKPRKSFTILLQGGNTTAQSDIKWSSRDAYGSIIQITTSHGNRLMQHQAGEGLSAQNTDRVFVGLKPDELVKSIQIYWPSGKTTQRSEIPVDLEQIIIQEKSSP